MKKLLPFYLASFSLLIFISGCTPTSDVGVQAPVEKFSGADAKAIEASVDASCSEEKGKKCCNKCDTCKGHSDHKHHLTKKEADKLGVKCGCSACKK